MEHYCSLGEDVEPPLATVDKAIDVLFELHAAEAPIGVTALGRALGLPKSSTHRLLAALRRRGLVEQDERGRYQLGIGLIALGLGVLEREPAVVAARPVIEQEAEALGETFFLVAARAGQLVVLDKAEGTGFLRAAPRVGAVVPVHATAVGKLQLAFAPSELDFDPETRFGAGLEAFTPATRTSQAALRGEIEFAREWGWAANVDEWIAGLSVLAAPVVHRGRLLAHVALAAPSARAAELGLEALAERVVKTAERIAGRLAGEAGGAR
jgi:DNA-binding IclR family transcriptional regulator